MHASVATQRALIWISILLMVIFGISLMVLMGFMPPPPPTLNAAQVLALYSVHPLEFRAGVVLGLFSGAFLLPWAVVIYVQMARLERGVPVLALLQLTSGAVGTVVVWGAPFFWGAAAFSLDRDPALTLVLHDLGWLIFVTPLCLFPMQLASIGVLSLIKSEPDTNSAFPRWIGYLTLWQAVQCLGGLFAMVFKTGPFAWNGLFAFYLPLTLFGVWVAAIAYTMLRALRHQEAAEKIAHIVGEPVHA